MRVLAVHIEKATESGVEGRQATVTMPLSQQIRKAHTGSQARSQPGGHGKAVAAAEGKPGMPRQFARSHSGSRLLSLAPTVTISLSLYRHLHHRLPLSISFCRLASFDCVKQDLCYSCHFLTLTLPIYVPGSAQAPSNQDTVR